MLELSSLDLDEIATALQDQTDDEYCWLIDPQSGQIGFWTEDGGSMATRRSTWTSLI